jgi:Mg2+-importing ATPase
MLAREAPQPQQQQTAQGADAARAAPNWLAWLVSLASLAAVVVGAVHFSEERAFMQLLERAEPWWLGWALLLQCGTYVAQGEAWLVVTRAARTDVPRRFAYELSLVKLFVDQALPSGGISGTVVVADALAKRGIPRNVVMASVVVDIVSYYAVYVLALAARSPLTLSNPKPIRAPSIHLGLSA